MESSSKGSRRLADLCTDLLALTVQIRAGGDPGGGEEVRRQVDRGLYRLELEARESGFPGDWVEPAKYALCAFLDESILVSTLPFRDDWSAKPLQLELFGERLAGAGFFKRLTEMGRRMAEMEQVIEVWNDYGSSRPTWRPTWQSCARAAMSSPRRRRRRAAGSPASLAGACRHGWPWR
jgi:type VI protein secretion system component VasF